MCARKPPRHRRLALQHGAAIVEFALVALVFLSLLLGIIEFGRVLFAWNAAAEATRWGARIAVVCDRDDDAIEAHMREILPQFLNAAIEVEYAPAGCDRSNCSSVTVKIEEGNVTPLIPILSVNLSVPPFATTLPRESMESANAAGDANPVCD